VFKSGVVCGECELADDCVNAVLSEFKRCFEGLAKLPFTVSVEPETRILEAPERETPCGGFTATYRAICNYVGVAARDDICWDIDHLVAGQKLQRFGLGEFENPIPADIHALLHSLRFNAYFTALDAADYPLARDKAQLEGLLECMRGNTALTRLDISGIGAKPEFLAALFTTIAANRALPLTDINLSGNTIDAGAASALAKFLETTQHGISSLNLANCGIDKKSAPIIGSALKKNPKTASSLSVLNLANNKLEAEGSAAIAAFLSSPNMLTHLSLRSTQSSLETVVGALVRGCQELRRLDVSGSRIPPKAVTQLVQWIKSSSQLKMLNLSSTGITADGLRDIIIAIGQNVYLEEVQLKAKDNAFGDRGAAVFACGFDQMKNVRALDLADNDLGDDGVAVVAHALCQNEGLKFLDISGNLSAKAKRTQPGSRAVEALVALLESDCPLESLELRGGKSAQPRLEDLLTFIYAIGVNDSLLQLNVNGNGMGNKGAIALGKMLQTNKTLHTLHWDDNGTTLPGFQAFLIGLDRNRALKTMPLPVNDISAAMKNEGAHAGEGTRLQKTVLDIQACVSRNQSPTKFEASQGMSAGGLLMNTGHQQMVDAQLLKIKRVDVKKLAETPENRLVIEDSQRAEKLTGTFQLVREEVQTALEVEMKKKLVSFVGELAQLVGSMKSQMRQRIVETISGSLKSIDEDTARRLGVAIEFGTKAFDHTTLERILVSAAGAEIMMRANECFASAAELATDYMYEKLMDSLDEIYEDILADHNAPAEPDAAPSPAIATEPTAAATSPTVTAPASAAVDRSAKEGGSTKPAAPRESSMTSKPKHTPLSPTAAAPASPATAADKRKSADATPAATTTEATTAETPAAATPTRPAPTKLSDKKALVAGMLARGGMMGRPMPTSHSAAETAAAAAAVAAVQEKKDRPVAQPRKHQAPKKGEKDSVLAKASTAEVAGPALAHATKDRARVPGRKGKTGHRPPTRRPNIARPLAPGSESSSSAQ